MRVIIYMNTDENAWPTQVLLGINYLTFDNIWKYKEIYLKSPYEYGSWQRGKAILDRLRIFCILIFHVNFKVNSIMQSG